MSCRLTVFYIKIVRSFIWNQKINLYQNYKDQFDPHNFACDNYKFVVGRFLFEIFFIYVKVYFKIKLKDFEIQSFTFSNHSNASMIYNRVVALKPTYEFVVDHFLDCLGA